MSEESLVINSAAPANVLANLREGQLITISQGNNYAMLVDSPGSSRVPTVGMNQPQAGKTYIYRIQKYSYNPDAGMAKITLGIPGSGWFLTPTNVPGLELAMGVNNDAAATLILKPLPDGFVSIGSAFSPPGPYFRKTTILDVGVFLKYGYDEPTLGGAFNISIVG